MNHRDWPGTAAEALPDDTPDATIVARVWDPAVQGPSVVAVHDGLAVDLSGAFATMSILTELPDPARAVAEADGPVLGAFDAVLANTPPERRDADRPWLLSPIDLHAVKAAGVTFAVSLIERVIEERAHGDLGLAAEIRGEVVGALGSDIAGLVPGSPEALRLAETLKRRGLWSQYLEVGIGPDAEVFTKAPVLGTVGTATDVGVRGDSHWNNPEPEVVLVVASTGKIVGATLGNDVNLRDIEGRSALLLGQAKDNTASAAVGPVLRLFDRRFDLDRLRAETVELVVAGEDGFELRATSPLGLISRDPADLVRQAIGTHHQYPDGFALYLGTLFAPTQDRDAPGKGFTHHPGDVVRISSPGLGTLVNRVRFTSDVEPWTYGIGAFLSGVVRRGLLTA